MASDKYTQQDGLILKALNYHMFFMVENSTRRLITDPLFVKFLTQLHSGNKTFNPNNPSQMIIQTIDQDEEMYEIPVGDPYVMR